MPPAAEAASHVDVRPPGAPRAGHAPTARREGRALGSPLRFLVEPGPGPALVDRAWAEIRDEFEAVDAAMSRFREDSELTHLNRGGRASRAVSRRLAAALAAADRAHRLTGGLFDARIVLDLERLGFVGVPQARRTITEPDARGTWLRRDGRRAVEVLEPVDLGGIGKGLALRWAARRASAVLGARGFLLDAGGDIVTRGQDAGCPWSIGIEDPSGGVAPVATCSLPVGWSIATSSVRLGRTLAPDGRPAHHLIDPDTGEPGGAGLLAVTVAFPDPAWAEVWTKALFLEGAHEIAAVARARGLAAWWIGSTGEVSMTPAAREITTWVRAEAGTTPNPP